MWEKLFILSNFVFVFYFANAKLILMQIIKRKTPYLLSFILFSLVEKTAYSQDLNKTFTGSKNYYRTNNDNYSNLFQRNYLGFELIASMLPKAKITKDEGNYQLQSRLQSAYDAGINYIYNFNKKLSITTGFHVVIGKRIFFAEIPPEDLKDFYTLNEPLLLEDKEIWGSIRIPILIENKLTTNGIGLISIKGGMSLRYSGFMPDEGFGWILSKPNGEQVEIFEANFSTINKPWITFLAGVSKIFILNNYNPLSVGLQADISTTYFFKGSYVFKIPGQPITSGTYEINGSALGISINYIFTGTNKRLIHNYQKE